MSNGNVVDGSVGNIYLENNNINIRNTSIFSNNNENYEYKDDNKKIEWKHYEQISAHLKPDIERVWFLIQKLDILLLVHNQGHYPLIITNGKDTRKEGNEFHGNIFGSFPFVAKVYKNSDYPEFKKIEWLFYLKNKYHMSIKIELFQVTEDNSTTILEKIKFENYELFSELNKFFNYDKSRIFNVLEKILENEPINLIIYESGLINGKMEDIWEFITDFSKLTIVAPNNYFPSNINLNKLVKGQRESFFIKGKKEKGEFSLELEYREERKGWNKWLIICNFYKKNSETKEGIIIIQLTKINNNLCQCIIIQKNLKAQNAEDFREISKEFKYVIISIKDYFDNFFSNNKD